MNSLCRTLANEETDITSVAVRPGMVDTGVRYVPIEHSSALIYLFSKMQAQIRKDGATTMIDSDVDRFVAAHAKSALVKPEDCGHVIAALAIKAPKSLSGMFVSWDSEECKEFRRNEMAA